ncbi:hypothetical protein Smp_153000 [Schistosoma mansoni]|uniref:hypothetical protein n=1 Tax=Schistosoma mansoni TaxID=6183 RepID=UPI00022DBF48|nr:hypothetical protein Smp_153000 [Schistosoma mansoni]|eukprot:XP_018653591.1 hypothetical protein Smp_153000 [Schistosoma mansoni]
MDDFELLEVSGKYVKVGTEKYIDLLGSIKPVNDYLHFNPVIISESDCNQWENWNLQASSTIGALQLNYSVQENISLSYTPLLPVSFWVEMIPYPRLYPGRSFFFSRLDNLNRIRLAIGLNQWGKTGECMELWIHHELFYSLEPTPKISTYYTGSGLVNHAGLVIVPLPNYQFNTNKLITLIIEFIALGVIGKYVRHVLIEFYRNWEHKTLITNTSVKVYKNCKLYNKPLFSIDYRQNIKYHHLHGDRFENKSKESSRMDKFYALSGGPYHGDRFLGLMKRLKMFFTEYGARKYCSDDSVTDGTPALTEEVGAERDVSGDASTGTHSVSHMDRVDSSWENLQRTQVSSEQPASTSEHQTGDDETRDTSTDSDSISHMGVGVGASEENLLDTQVSSEQPASTSERQTGDDETRDTSTDSDSISHMGVGVGASEENLLDTQMYKPTDLMNQSSDDLYVGLVKQKTEKQSHNKNTTYITFEEVSGTYRMNRRADYNYTMNGPAGPHGSMGYCPETICPPIDMSSFKGIQGETGSSEWCDRSCKTIDGMIGLKGIKGLKGDMGDTLILSFSKALQLIKYTINITSSNYFPKGQKGDKGERIQRKLIQRSIYTQNNRNIHRRKRQQQHDYDHLNLRIHPLQENKKRVKRSFMNSLNQSTNDSSILFTGSSFANFEKQKILGVKIFHHPNEFKTISSILPVGALVVTELPNHEILSLINDDHLSKWDFNKEIQWNPVNSLGLFMKIENIHNTWKRLHVKDHYERRGFVEIPNLQIYNSSSSKESSSKINTPRHKEKIVFAFHPVPLTGGSFSGWHGANKKCHETALHHLGIPDFKVLLVDRNFPIERHIKWQYQHVPIINLGSQTVFTKWRDFLYGIRSNTNVPLYDLYGMPDLKVHSK